MHFLSWKHLTFTDGFWKQWQDIASTATADAIYSRFQETGRIQAMDLNWTPDMPYKPHVFWDSDIAKWMEGTAYLLYHRPSSPLRQKLEAIIEKIQRGQTPEGYFNSAILTVAPQKRFRDRTNHELYTAGHLIEAAVAHYEATGETYFLHAMEGFAQYIHKVFVEEGTPPYKTPGHQELELALVRLYQATDQPLYLELSRHFVEARGTDPADRVFSVENGTWPASPPLDNQLLYNDTYAQDEAPARELDKAGGHGVRAMYFYTAMAMIAEAYGDTGLFHACTRLWNDLASKKIYVTGGVSAERFGEAIGTDYVLPLDLSYAETCASVAMANFSKAMFCLAPLGKYMDMLELQMYNGALVGLSLAGDTFFYDNALLCRPEVTDFFTGIHARPLYPAYRRQKIFDCSCCPPNIYRFIAALGQYFYSVGPEVLYIHHYSSSTARITLNRKALTLVQETCYPWEGDVQITLHTDGSLGAAIALRIPGWCPEYELLVNGRPVNVPVRDGYAFLSRQWQNGDAITLKLSMPIAMLYGNPRVVEASGRVALRRGPIIYCLEGVDQTDYNLFDLSLPAGTEGFTLKKMDILGHRITAITGPARIAPKDLWAEQLYLDHVPEPSPGSFTAIPYYYWANRQVSDMTVWIRQAT